MRFIRADTVYPISSKPIKNGIVVLKDSGEIEDVLDEKDEMDETKVEYHKGSVCPGFVNAHCHLELSHMKGLIPEKGGLLNFAKEIITKRRSFSKEQIQAGIEEADKIMWENVNVAVGDISNTPDT